MMARGQQRRVPSWLLGTVLIAVIAIASLLAFTKQLPWAESYEVQAIFNSASNVRVSAPVRIAGVEVGEVAEIEHLPPVGDRALQAGFGSGSIPDGKARGTAVVTMEIADAGRPIKTDATFELRPRLFLEGNLFVDVRPGSPGAEEAPDGHVFSVDQTATSVQLDQVLTTLQADVREQLQIALEELGSALVDHGGAKGFQELYRTSPGSYKYTSQVSEAFLGRRTHDLSGLVRHLDQVIEGLGRNEQALQSLVTNLRVFSGSFAARDAALEDGIAELPGVLRSARPAFDNLNRSFPPLRALAREILPGVESTPETLEVATPFIHQVRALVARDELRGLVADLRPTVPALAELARETNPFLDASRRLSSCFNEVVIPWSNDTVRVVDPTNAYPHAPTGRVFEETGYGLVGVAGESRSGDANGQWVRVRGGGGTNLVRIPAAPGREEAFGVVPFDLLGAVPRIEDSGKTRFEPTRPCERQEPPDLAAAVGEPPAQEPIPAATSENLPRYMAGALGDYEEIARGYAEAEEMRDEGQVARAKQREDELARAQARLFEDYRHWARGLGGDG